MAVEKDESLCQVVEIERPMSWSTDIIVSAEYHRVPGLQACSFDFDIDSEEVAKDQGRHQTDGQPQRSFQLQ